MSKGEKTEAASTNQIAHAKLSQDANPMPTMTHGQWVVVGILVVIGNMSNGLGRVAMEDVKGCVTVYCLVMYMYTVTVNNTHFTNPL